MTAPKEVKIVTDKEIEDAIKYQLEVRQYNTAPGTRYAMVVSPSGRYVSNDADSIPLCVQQYRKYTGLWQPTAPAVYTGHRPD